MVGVTSLAASVGEDKALAAELLTATRRELVRTGAGCGDFAPAKSKSPAKRPAAN
jgi:hypothetical protein